MIEIDPAPEVIATSSDNATDELFSGHWYAIASTRELKKFPVGIKRFGEDIVLWRAKNGEWLAMTDRCPHRSAKLSDGKIINDHLACPFHGYEFNRKGQCVKMPCEGDRDIPEHYCVNTYTVCEAGDWLWLWRGPKTDNLPKPPIEPLFNGLYFGEIVSEWNTHYSRAIEVQVDYAHLPYLHGSSIGRGMLNKNLHIDSERTSGYIKVWQKDRGDSQYAMIRYPNLWINKVGPSMFIAAAFAPIDDNHCRVYVRYYHNFKFILPRFVAWIGAQMSRWIVNEDRPIVEKQLPPNSDHADELLTPADAGIIGYRLLRRAHQSQRLKDE